MSSWFSHELRRELLWVVVAAELKVGLLEKSIGSVSSGLVESDVEEFLIVELAPNGDDMLLGFGSLR